MIQEDDPRVQFATRLNGKNKTEEPEERTMEEKIRERVITTDQLRNLPRPEWLVQDIIPQNATCMIYGAPGSYKTFLAIAWGLCVAEGVPWEGDGAHDVASGNVVYIAAEGARGIPSRVEAWETDHNRRVGNNALWFPEPLNLLDAGLVGAFIDVLAEHTPRLVVIDTLARCTVGGDENSVKDMGKAIDHMGWMIRQLGSTVLFVHHSTKDGGVYRGSSAILGAVETAIEVQNEGSNVTVKCSKQKDAEEFEDMALKAILCADSCILTPNPSGGTNTGSDPQVLHTLVTLFGHTGGTTNEWMEMAAIDYGVSRRTFFRAKNALVRHGFVENRGSEHRPKWWPTKLGLIADSSGTAREVPS